METLEEEVKKSPRVTLANSIVQELMRHTNNKDIVYGTVDRVEVAEGLGRLIVYVLFKNLCEVLIPEFEFFEDSFQFEEKYNELSDEDKITYRRMWLKQYKGAEIPFVPLGQKLLKKEGKIITVASRKQAMERIRNYCFNGTEEQSLYSIIRPPENPQQWMSGTATVLLVMHNYIHVEVYGVETRIDDFNGTIEKCNSLKECYKTGQKITVYVRRFHEQGKYGVYVGATVRKPDTYEEHRQIEVGSFYYGKVDSYNKKKNAYSIILENGVRGLCDKGNSYRNLPIYDNDFVHFLVVRKEENFVVGIVVK